MRRLILVACVIGVGAQLDAQSPISLDTVRVSVTRDTARSPLTLPFAITAGMPDSVRPGQKHLSLDETLLVIPGVFAASRQNPSQDPRISIRGFGSRSAFGVRGVRVLWNGIPLTVADGQTPVDYIDLEAVDRVEIIRGSASALFGNSSGGVIALSSLDTTRRLAFKQWNESGELRKSSVRMSGSTSRSSGGVGVNRTSGRSFRNYSRVEATRASGSLSSEAFGQHWSLNLSLLDMPIAENPGSITLSQMTGNARLADPLSVRKGAGKSVSQKQIGLSTSRALGRGDISALVFGGMRQLENPLTFATVDLNRTTGGLSAKATLPFLLAGNGASLNVGLDGQVQNDDRHELENCIDVPLPPVSVRCPVAARPTGAIRRNQRELVTSVGSYAKSEVALGQHTLLSAAARHDVLRFKVSDRMPVPDAQKQSGDRTMIATSPMIGLVYRFAHTASFYASVSTAFETPTVTELANKPDGTTGLNGNLTPQLSKTAEMGVKGFLRSGLRYDLAGFLTGVNDELIPFEIPGGAGRRFYRNAGHTKRSGVEASAMTSFGPADLSVAYTGSRFHFDRYSVAGVSYAGKTIPGIPGSKLDAVLTIRRARSFATSEVTAASSVFVDDLNTARAPGYSVFNLRAGTSVPMGSLSLRPVIGVNNILNRRYSASVSVNAAGGKYYEPASERLLYGMVEIESRF